MSGGSWLYRFTDDDEPWRIMPGFHSKVRPETIARAAAESAWKKKPWASRDSRLVIVKRSRQDDSQASQFLVKATQSVSFSISEVS